MVNNKISFSFLFLYRPNHSSPEEAKQPSVVASSCLKRQREDDAPQEQQQQKLGVHSHPPEELQVESQEEQLQNMCQFGFRDLTPTPDTMPPRVRSKWEG